MQQLAEVVLKRGMWRVALSVMLVVLALGVAACGDDDSSSSGGGSDQASAEKCPENGKVETLSIGTQPIAPLASVYLGIDKGFFKDENIDLKLNEGLQGGAASIAAVMSGTDDLGFTDWVGLDLAVQKGLPIRPVAPAAGVAESEKDAYLVVMARKDSGIKKPEDLAGKTIGVNALNNITDVTIKAALKQLGVDYKSVKFLEVPFPQTVPSVAQKRVDAAFYVEPNVGAGFAEGHVPVLYPASLVAPNGAVSAYFTSEKTLKEKKCAVDGFVRAMNKSNQYAADNPDELRATIPKFTQIPLPVAQKMRLPEYGEPGTEAATKITDAMVDLGLLDEPLDIDELIAYPFDGTGGQ